MVLCSEGAVFFRLKQSGSRSYLQIVENQRQDGAVRQNVIATIGRADELAARGALASLLASGARFCEQVMLLSALQSDLDGPRLLAKRIGPALLFGRLWHETGCGAVIGELLAGREFEFPVERAVFTTVLHRIMVSGADRACEKWMTDSRSPRPGSWRCITCIGPWRGWARNCRPSSRRMRPPSHPARSRT